MDDHTCSFGQIAPGPHVMIAGKEMHFDSAFGKMLDMAEKLIVFGLTFVLPEILVPEIKNIAQKVDGAGIAAHMIEQMNNFVEMGCTAFKSARAKVCVA